MPVAVSDRRSCKLVAPLETREKKAIATITVRPRSDMIVTRDQLTGDTWLGLDKLSRVLKERIDYLFILLWFHRTRRVKQPAPRANDARRICEHSRLLSGQNYDVICL